MGGEIRTTEKQPERYAQEGARGWPASGIQLESEFPG